MKNRAEALSESLLQPDRSRSFRRYWLPVILWMLLIFGLSTDAGSPRHTSRIIGPLLRWLIPNVSEETIHDLQVVIRKTAHVSEYAVLAWLVWRARRKPVRGDRRPWIWSDAAFALGFAVLFAASDEWHQTFVPTREGHVSDVFIDGAGAALGLFLRWRLGRLRKHG